MTSAATGRVLHGHVYVVISGYGKRIVPAATPIEFSRFEDDALIATVAHGSAVQRRRIAVDALLDRGPSDALAEISDGPARDEWWLETAVYSVPFPAEWTAIITGGVSPAFDLVREANRAIFVQTARNRPTLETLVAPGQTVVARGSDDYADWLELSYVHDERPWRQRHSLMRTRAVAMITGQSPADEFTEVRAIHEELTRRALFAP